MYFDEFVFDKLSYPFEIIKNINNKFLRVILTIFTFFLTFLSLIFIFPLLFIYIVISIFYEMNEE
mgnify:FL=1